MADTADLRKALDELADYFDRMGDYADLADHHAWQYEAADEVREWSKKNYPRPD